MCKSSVLGFVLVFAFIFGLEKPSWKLAGIITAMTVGVLMMVAGETSFDTLGFVLVMSAAASSGFRWSLTQILLLRNPATSNPFASIFYLAPVMFACLLIIALPVEGPIALVKGLGHLAEAKGALLGFLILLFPGSLAFMMVASEFALLQRTSVVTLSICGIFKEVVTISVASLVFGDELTPINVSGVVVTIACIAVYNWMKIRKMRAEAHQNATNNDQNQQEYAPVSTLADDPADESLFEEGNGNDSGGAGSNSDDNNDNKTGTTRTDIKHRSSTSSLLRNSLSINTNGMPPDQREREAVQSPRKRPEYLD